MICKVCGVDRTIDTFRVTTSHGRPWRSPKCRPCELARQKELWDAKTEHTCHVCHKTLPIGQFASRTYRCRSCQVAQGRLRTKECRQAEHARESARKGKTYRTWDEYSPWWKKLGTGYGRAVNLKAHGWRARCQGKPTLEQEWVERLRVELPHMYDPTLAISTLEWRARYNLDPEFKAKQIRRTHKRRSDEEHGLFFEDGTLTGEVVRSLFAKAKACLYCDTPMRGTDKTLDHVWPRSKGGWHSVSNAVVCCHSCNSKKHGNSPRKWLNRLPKAQHKHVLAVWRSIGVRDLEQPCLVA